MKTLFAITTACIAMFIFSFTVFSQNQVIGKIYTDEQINSMINSYFAASERDVIPTEIVSRAFARHFPNASNIDWEVSNNIYKVDYDIKWTDYEAWYDASGNLLMYIFDIKVSMLPAIVRNTVIQKYPKFKIDDVDKFYKGTVVGYKVSVENGETEYKGWFREDGTFIKDQPD